MKSTALTIFNQFLFVASCEIRECQNLRAVTVKASAAVQRFTLEKASSPIAFQFLTMEGFLKLLGNGTKLTSPPFQYLLDFEDSII